MAIGKNDPFKDLLTMQDRINRLFEDTMMRGRGLSGGLEEGNWSPPVDIYETAKEFVLRAELPGITREDIAIEITENTLVLKGERKFCHDLDKENYFRVERSYGNFRRTFTLPVNLAQEQITAKFKDGVLKIILPKNEEVPAKVITVQAE